MAQKIQVQDGNIVYSATPTVAGAPQTVAMYVDGSLSVGVSGDGIITSEPLFALNMNGDSGLNLSSGFGSINLLSQVSANESVGNPGQSLVSRGANLSPEWTTPVYAFTMASIPPYVYFSNNTFGVWDSTGIVPLVIPPITDIYWDTFIYAYIFNTPGTYSITVTIKAVPINAITGTSTDPLSQPEPWPSQSTVLRTLIGGTATPIFTADSTHSTYKLDADPTSTHEDRTWCDTFMVEAQAGSTLSVESYAYNIDYSTSLVNFSASVIFTKIGTSGTLI